MKSRIKVVKVVCLSIVAVIALSILFTGCNTGSNKSSTGVSTTQEPSKTQETSATSLDKNISTKLNVQYMGNESQKELADGAIKKFNERFPNVKVTLTFSTPTTWGQYSDKIIALVASGNAPDLIHIPIEGTRLMQSKDILAPLDGYMSSDPAGKEMISDIDKSLLDAFTVDGKLYEVPIDFNDMVIFYNTKLLKEEGLPAPKANWTWNEFLDYSKKLTKGEGDKKVWGFGLPAFHAGIIPWFITSGTNTLNADWTASNLNDPKVASALQFVHDLVYVSKVTPQPEQNVDIYNLFGAERMAMVGGGMWIVNNLHQNNFEDWDIVQWPQNGGIGTDFGVGGMAIMAASKNKDIAWELLKEFGSKEFDQAIAAMGTATPVRRSVIASDVFKKQAANAELFYTALEGATAIPSPVNYSEYESIFMRHFTEIMTNQKSAPDAMADAHKELTDAFAKLKK